MTITGLQFVEVARTLRDVPYRFGAEARPPEKPDAIDCSELVEYVGRQLGVTPRVPDGSWKQYQHCHAEGGAYKPHEAVYVAGALLFRFRGDPLGRKRPRAAHVAIATGDGDLVEASSDAGKVRVRASEPGEWTHAGLLPGVEYALPRAPGEGCR